MQLAVWQQGYKLLIETFYCEENLKKIIINQILLSRSQILISISRSWFFFLSGAGAD